MNYVKVKSEITLERLFKLDQRGSLIYFLSPFRLFEIFKHV